tara:strand:+ start:7151 stop:7837 length:687 start_codon:yes stop_codon:yes gene_type:complete
MSDLEDFDSEPDDKDESDKEDKEEKDQKLSTSKTSVVKKLQPEFNISDDELAETDDDDDDDDDAIENASTVDNETIADQEPTMESTNLSILSPINSDVESEDEEYLQKFDDILETNYLENMHPECNTANSVEIQALSQVIRKNNVIIDTNHRTNPILTKYEKTKILGLRTKQLNAGNKPYIDVPPNIIDNLLIAQMELKSKKLPMIIRRPLPNGESEYWKLNDLEQIY